MFNISQREMEVFVLLVKGKSYYEIADVLNISPHTVKNHIRSLYKKTNAQSRAELIYKYYKNIKKEL